MNSFDAFDPIASDLAARRLAGEADKAESEE